MIWRIANKEQHNKNYKYTIAYLRLIRVILKKIQT